MKQNEINKKVQKAMNDAGVTPGFELTGTWGPKSESESDKYNFEITAKKKAVVESPGPEWMKAADAEMGKKETDVNFQNKLNPYWAKAGLPQFKGLVGSARAWCSLFVFFVLASSGFSTKKLTAAAISGDNVGQAINYKVDGMPRGAIVRINHSSNCKSSTGNHIGLSTGDCTAEDVKSGAFNMTGGNQGDMVKVSAFPVNDICSVRWPDDEKGNKLPLPGKVLVSKNCKGKVVSGESTR